MTPGIGYCGFDRTRRPLRGDEMRGCWSGRQAAEPVAAPARAAAPSTDRPRGFVPLDSVSPTAGAGEPPPAPLIPPPALDDPLDRVTLFDLDA